MLSIIISSYQPHYYQALEKNIAETIGIPYEVIKVDNPGKMGICEAYNHGAQKAQYDYLLFLHEDVLFETQNWGKELIELLNLENCGVIGVAGTDYYGYVPYQWANRKSKIHIIQSNKQKNKKEKILRKNFKKNSTIEKVKKKLINLSSASKNVLRQHAEFTLKIIEFQLYLEELKNSETHHS